MFIRILSLSSLFLSLSFSLQGQKPSDCFTALDACSLDTSMLNYVNLKGAHTERISNPCWQQFGQNILESNTLWIKYAFSGPGQFLFTARPADSLADLDFLVFKSASASCTDLENVRCMFSGEQGGDTIDVICLGPTGLSLEASDTFEAAGCQVGDDNFLASVAVAEGDVLYLAIIDFSPDSRYQVTYTGDAELACTTSSRQKMPKEKVTIYPNPATGAFAFSADLDLSQIEKMNIIDSQGITVMTKIINEEKVEISGLVPGLYVVQLVRRHSLPLNLKLVVTL